MEGLNMKTWHILFVLIIFGALSLLTPVRAVAAELCVDNDNTTGIEDGSSIYPYNTIQEAIDTALGSEENTVRVAGGDYTENISADNKTVHLLGGFEGGTPADYAAGTGGVFDAQYPDTYVTHIQGDGTDAVVKLLDSGASTLDGFRITGGTGHAGEYSVKGGGVYVYGGSPTISRNTIEDNDTRHETLANRGGGIFADESNVRIIGNWVRNNVTGSGAGIAVDGGEILIQGNTIQNNIAVGDHGGGLYISAKPVDISHNLVLENEVGRSLGYGWGGGAVIVGEESSATLSYNRFSGNYAPTAGGGVFIDDGAVAVLDHELIFNNKSENNGGAGVYVDGAWGEIGSTATLTNCSIIYNICTGCLSASGLFVEYYSKTTIMNSIFWGNAGDDVYADGTSEMTITYTDSEETISGMGNLNKDPLFADSGNNDYHLKSRAGRWDPTAGGGTGGWIADAMHSPCIDMGNPLSGYANEPLPNGGRINMGVYGNTSEASKTRGSMPPAYYVAPDGICDARSPCESSINAAMESADPNTTIKIEQGNYNEDVGLDQSKDLTLESGLDSEFNSVAGKSTIWKMTIRKGSVVLNKGCLGIMGMAD